MMKDYAAIQPATNNTTSTQLTVPNHNHILYITTTILHPQYAPTHTTPQVVLSILPNKHTTTTYPANPPLTSPPTPHPIPAQKSTSIVRDFSTAIIMPPIHPIIYPSTASPT